MRASANGKGPGLPVVIAGGEHGDVPLEASGGTVIADLVVDDPRPLILDLSDFPSNAAQDRFVADFAEHLYRRKAHHRQPLHLIFDEADSFAPQRPMPGQARMLGAIEALVRRGRQRGIGATFITQRPAVLNKNVLTQIELLVVLQLTAPQDRAAIEDWVRGHGTREQCDKLLQSLASLQRGQAWFWSPSRYDLFQLTQIRKRETFDSSKTPAVGESLIQPRQLAPVDLALLRERLSNSLEMGSNTDPAQLRAHIVRLQKELEARPVPSPVRLVQIPIFIADEVEQLGQTAARLKSVGEQLLLQADEICALLRDGSCVAPDASLSVEVKPEKTLALHSTPQLLNSKTATSSMLRSSKGQGLPLLQRKILNVLAHFPAGHNQRQIAVLACYNPQGVSFLSTMAALKKEGLIEGTPTLYTLSKSGKTLAGKAQPVLQGETLRQLWSRRLTHSEKAILDALSKNHSRSLPHSKLASLTGFDRDLAGFTSTVTKLRSLGLLTGKRELALNPLLI